MNCIGKLYRDPRLNVIYVVIDYFKSSVPGTLIRAPTYEVRLLDQPDRTIYASVSAVEKDWEPISEGYQFR